MCVNLLIFLKKAANKKIFIDSAVGEYTHKINHINEAYLLTKNINSKLSIDRREKSINKMYEPPGYIESDSYREKDDTAQK